MTAMYRQHFHACLIGGIEELLVRIRAAEPLVPEDDRQQAWHLLSYALGVADAWPATRMLLFALAPKMEQAGFREDWILYLEEGVRLSKKLNDLYSTAEYELQIGILYRLQNILDVAEIRLWASVTGFERIQERQGQARALNELAWVKQLQHKYEEGKRVAQQALSLLGDLDPERWMNYRVQGMLAMGQGQLQAAEAYHRKALAGFEAEGEQRRIAWGKHNLAYALREQEKFEEAILLYKQAATMLAEIGDAHHWAFVTMNLGITYFHHEEPDAAIDCYTDAQIVFTRLQHKLYMAHIYNNLGLSYLAICAFAKSEDNFLNAIKLFEEIDESGWRLNSIDGLAMVYLSMEQYAKAIHLLDDAIRLLPTIAETPNYKYLHQSLDEHLQKAYQGLRLR